MWIREEHADARQVRLPAKSSLPFWPQYLSKYATVTVEGTKEGTTPFSYSILQTLLLRLDNQYGGIYVQTQISDSNVTCILNTYKAGRPALCWSTTRGAALSTLAKMRVAGPRWSYRPAVPSSSPGLCPPL